jgi:cell shape-determining protein MreC
VVFFANNLLLGCHVIQLYAELAVHTWVDEVSEQRSAAKNLRASRSASRASTKAHLEAQLVELSVCKRAAERLKQSVASNAYRRHLRSLCESSADLSVQVD